MKTMTLPAIAALALLAADTNAHHSGAGFDRTAQASIQGTVTRFEWRNPHVYLWVESEIGNGEMQTWEIEGYPPAILKRLGWGPDDIKVGDQVTVGGHPGRDPAQFILMMNSLEKAGAAELDMRARHMMASLSQGAADKGDRTGSLAGTWVTLLNPQAMGQFSPRLLAITERGREAMANYNEAIDSPALSCTPFAAPTAMMSPDIKSIEIRDDVVIIRSEFDAVERTVHMNVDSHDGAVPSVQGHSIGRWEDGMLVIDTTGFTPQRAIMIGVGLPSGPDKHLVERLALNREGTQLAYSFELTDPDFLASPVKVDGMQWVYRPDLEYTAPPCDLDNARRFVN